MLSLDIRIYCTCLTKSVLSRRGASLTGVSYGRAINTKMFLMVLCMTGMVIITQFWPIPDYFHLLFHHIYFIHDSSEILTSGSCKTSWIPVSLTCPDFLIRSCFTSHLAFLCIRVPLEILHPVSFHIGVQHTKVNSFPFKVLTVSYGSLLPVS